MSGPVFLWFFLAFSSWPQNSCLFFTHCICNQSWKKRDRPRWVNISFIWKAKLSRKISLPPCKLPPAETICRLHIPSPSCKEGLESESRTIVIGLPYTMAPKLRFLKVWKMKDIDIGSTLVFVMQYFGLSDYISLSLIRLSTIWCHTPCLIHLCNYNS